MKVEPPQPQLLPEKRKKRARDEKRGREGEKGIIGLAKPILKGAARSVLSDVSAINAFPRAFTTG